MRRQLKLRREGIADARLMIAGAVGVAGAMTAAEDRRIAEVALAKVTG
jgi:uncharacterized protein GlcG (DUF336 family)